jgi:polynucleotide 5'-kinase involved in rRNA processing
MPRNITKKVFEGIDQRVAIITVLGPQSSGKSTLLNFLFGCDFGTS